MLKAAIHKVVDAVFANDKVNTSKHSISLLLFHLSFPVDPRGMHTINSFMHTVVVRQQITVKKRMKQKEKRE